MFLYLAATAILLLAIHFCIPRNYHSFSFENIISKIPGPETIFYIGSKFILSVTNENYLSKLVNLVNSYPPLARLQIMGHYSIVATDVNDVETIMNSRSHITKSVEYDILRPWLGDGLLTSTGDRWFSRRKLLTPAFHFGIVEQYIDIFSKNGKVLSEKLGTVVDYPISVSKMVSMCTLDIVCETAMGTTVNAQHGGEKDYVAAVLEMAKLFQIRQFRPWLHRDLLFNILPTGRKQAKIINTLHSFTEKVIKGKINDYRNKNSNQDNRNIKSDIEAKKKQSFLELLVEISETEGKLSIEDIREEVDTFMFEGHDTTSAAIHWALYELASNPEIQALAHEELREIFGDSDRAPTSADLAEMKYLERVIKETLRLYPSVPIIARKLEQDVVLSGYTVPAGANVALFIFYIHRDPKLFSQPDKFIPDRFLPDRIAKRHPYSYIPFSAGPRNCIGQKFALMEEKVILSQILRDFKIQSHTPKDDVQYMGELILRPKNELFMSFTPRK